MNILSNQSDEFTHRHIGPNEEDTQEMLRTVGLDSIEELISRTVPTSIRMDHELRLPQGESEATYLHHLKETSQKNKICRNYIGQGYYDTHTPSVILRNVFENPGWYTQYTPYQAEISQGRLESLLNFQTMVSDLTALPLTNASLLDEATAAAEAMTMFFHTLNKDHHGKIDRPKFFVDHEVFTQTKDVILTRATPLNIEVVFGDYRVADIDTTYFGGLLQYPDCKGGVEDYRGFIATMHEAGGYVVMATDLLALTLLTPPGELGADAAIGCAQRFGVPMGYGGPHAAFFATKDDFKRMIPGRIIGISIDAYGNRALRMALGTREQHIKREKATSNICTAQALLANMAAMYAVYHGPHGLVNIAKRVATLTQSLSNALNDAGVKLHSKTYFDTITVVSDNKEAIRVVAEQKGLNFHYDSSNGIGISLDETTTPRDVLDIISVFTHPDEPAVFSIEEDIALMQIPTALTRTSEFLTQQVFNSHHSETQMMRYLKMLENKDLSLNTSMISLGSCTMKLNAASEMMPLSWTHWSKMHPFAPMNQSEGYLQIVKELSAYLCEITAFDACSLQPNSGAQGEYAGLLTIHTYHQSRNEGHRDVILIPISAHGTNPASAVMVGYKVVVVKALENGYIDLEDLKAKATQYAANLAGIMITYPSTYGIFEESVKEITNIVHENGGQVYMDGANMNAQVGLTAPGLIGADVCHLNLHKTFSIPHGGGGPGMGPICVKKHLEPFLPSHVMLDERGGHMSVTFGEDRGEAAHAVSAAPYGSASILLISYGYIRMLGSKGVRKSTEYAILNANYMRARLQNDFEILYTGNGGTCAHEFIVDLRPFKKSAEIEAEDVAKRLIDYGFHAPTMSFPVAGTIMIEPTESEDKAELDRFCDALLGIRNEIRAIEEGKADKQDNPLKNAPHTQSVITADEWKHAYTRQQAAFPLPYVRHNKFWPSVARVNNTVGDRNLICTCEPTESYMEA